MHAKSFLQKCKARQGLSLVRRGTVCPYCSESSSFVLCMLILGRSAQEKIQSSLSAEQTRSQISHPSLTYFSIRLWALEVISARPGRLCLLVAPPTYTNPAGDGVGGRTIRGAPTPSTSANTLVYITN